MKKNKIRKYNLLTFKIILFLFGNLSSRVVKFFYSAKIKFISQIEIYTETHIWNAQFEYSTLNYELTNRYLIFLLRSISISPRRVSYKRNTK